MPQYQPQRNNYASLVNPNKSFESDVGYAAASPTQLKLGVPGGFAAWNAVLTSSST
jgi:hypothetical protein